MSNHSNDLAGERAGEVEIQMVELGAVIERVKVLINKTMIVMEPITKPNSMGACCLEELGSIELCSHANRLQEFRASILSVELTLKEFLDYQEL